MLKSAVRDLTYVHTVQLAAVQLAYIIIIVIIVIIIIIIIIIIIRLFTRNLDDITASSFTIFRRRSKFCDNSVANQPAYKQYGRPRMRSNRAQLLVTMRPPG